MEGKTSLYIFVGWSDSGTLQMEEEFTYGNNFEMSIP